MVKSFMICGCQSMTSQDKYDKCLSLLAEMHDIIHIIIETGVDDGLTAMQLIEESITLIKTMENENVAYYPPLTDKEKKDKKIVH
jgi:hypothetical protein